MARLLHATGTETHLRHRFRHAVHSGCLTDHERQRDPVPPVKDGAPGANLLVPEPRSDRLSRPTHGPRWALSALDFKAHAVDEDGDHPLGVLITACGHRLLRGGLHDEPPGGLCPGCGHAVVARRVDGRPVRWARSPGDSRCHAVAHREAAHVAATGLVLTLRGATLPREDLDLAAQPSPPLCFWCVIGAVAEPPSPPQPGVT